METRARALLAAWNSCDLDGTMAFYADDVVLVSMNPKTAPGEPYVELRGKDALRRSMARLTPPVPQFSFVAAIEADTCMSIIVKDADGEQLMVSLNLNGEGLITRIVSIRDRSGGLRGPEG